jgi:hypothetical protein
MIRTSIRELRPRYTKESREEKDQMEFRNSQCAHEDKKKSMKSMEEVITRNS